MPIELKGVMLGDCTCPHCTSARIVFQHVQDNINELADAVTPPVETELSRSDIVLVHLVENGLAELLASGFSRKALIGLMGHVFSIHAAWEDEQKLVATGHVSRH